MPPRKSLLPAKGIAEAAVSATASADVPIEDTSLVDCKLSPAHELCDAAERGNVDKVKTLLAEGAPANSRGGGFGDTALHYAARCRQLGSGGDHLEVVRQLLAAKATPDPSCNRPLPPASDGKLIIGNYIGRTPLMEAAMAGSRDICLLLLEHRATPNREDIYENTAAQLARQVQGGLAAALLLDGFSQV
eukprot:gnl/MRDRNA2_/MRDRNA2_21027_c0_seq1.p1 gnl/MRDRNA2_/MRDRNA2_21027_c0~~gnl/MRDRNA2_/MRDRNA2_21027_c0_seq1.p1  ORF type:complete len:190 (+),score=40.89 gnl/MRDRNA2_/MRDRNA2_21027_c0_seq1:73-642(+)